MTDLVKFISNSEAWAWRGCRRRWWLGTHRGLTWKEEYRRPSALTTGSLMHDCMQAIYQGDDWREIIEAFREEIRNSPVQRPAELNAEADLVEIMVEGYEEWLADEGEDVGLEVLGVEVEATSELGEVEGHRLIGLGKFDLLVRLAGLVGFVDHKSSSSMDITESRRLSSSQFAWYARLLEGTDFFTDYERPRMAWINVVKKVKRSATAEGPFYHREEVPITDAMIQSVVIQMREIAGEIIRAEMRLTAGEDHRAVAYPNKGFGCRGCPFKNMCDMFDSDADAEGYIAEWYDARDPLERYEDIRGVVLK